MTRRRWVYTEGGKPLPEPVEVGEDFRNVQVSTGDLGKFQYAGLRATDGTPIDSREAHRAYMKRHNLTLTSDFKETWSEDSRAKAARAADEKQSRSFQDAVGRAFHERGKRR